MYTGKVVRFRTFAFVVALQLAATPAIGVVCDLTCDQPPAASSACHNPNEPQEGAALRGAGHACDHDQIGVRPTLLTSATAGNSVVTVFSASPATLIDGFAPVAHMTAVAMHGPPGPTGRSPFSRLSVLRI